MQRSKTYRAAAESFDQDTFSDEMERAWRGCDSTTLVVQAAINLLAGAVVAPLYEELLFRGFATTAWARVVAPATAIVRTSILFALAHVLTQGGEDFSQALAIAAVGAAGRLPVALALGWVFVRRRSLWASVGLHAAFNAILLVIAESAFENLPAG